MPMDLYNFINLHEFFTSRNYNFKIKFFKTVGILFLKSKRGTFNILIFSSLSLL